MHAESGKHGMLPPTTALTALLWTPTRAMTEETSSAFAADAGAQEVVRL